MSQQEQGRIVHRGRVFSVEVLQLRDRQGRVIERDIVRHPGAVLIVPILPDDRLVMIRNHRVAVQKELWEFPAGKLEQGEPPIEAAARELEEETGYAAGRIEPMGDFYTSPGFADELMRVFIADGLTHVGQRLEADENIKVEVIARTEALKMVEEGRLRDGKSLGALLMLERRLSRLAREPVAT